MKEIYENKEGLENNYFINENEIDININNEYNKVNDKKKKKLIK